jgi:hypothetical protein
MLFTLEMYSRFFSVMYVTNGIDNIFFAMLGLNLGFVSASPSFFHDIHLSPRKYYYKYLGLLCKHIQEDFVIIFYLL